MNDTAFSVSRHRKEQRKRITADMVLRKKALKQIQSVP